jgi:transporter family protein
MTMTSPSVRCFVRGSYHEPMDYRVWALLSALFAGLTALLAKKGVEDVPSNLALAVRVVFVLIFAWIIAAATKQLQLSQLTARNWWFLGASAIATGASWLCYFKAIQIGPISAVAPIDKLSFVIAMFLGFVVLREKVTPNLVVGAVLIVAGVLVTLK